MTHVPESVSDFLKGTRIVVAGVSRDSRQAANAVFRKLRDSGYDTIPVNPNADVVEDTECYRDLTSVPGPIDGVVVATPPEAAADIVRQCAERGINRVWFHRSFGQGSVSAAAIQECDERGLTAIVGGCPLMFCEPVDFGHRCMKWWLQRSSRVPR